MKNFLVVIFLLASCSFAGIIESRQGPTLYDSTNCCGGNCASGSATLFTCDGEQVAYSGLFLFRPSSTIPHCESASYLAPGYAPSYNPNACSKAGNNQCTTTSGASGTLIKDGNTGEIGCFSVPRYANYNPDNLSATCSDGYSSIGGKCMPMTCPQGMTCSTNANGTLKMTGSAEKIYVRKHSNGDIDAIMPNGAYVTYDKNGNPVRYVDKDGNIVKDSLSAGTASPFLTDPRGSAFNPIIAGGLFVAGALITSSGVLAMPITAGASAAAITAGSYMMTTGFAVGLYSLYRDASGNPVPPPSSSSSSSSSETTITLDINSIDTSSASSGSSGFSAPVSSTQNSNGSVTNVYKPNASTVITETKNSDGVNDYIVKDTSSNTVSSFSVNSSDLQDKGASSLQPQAIPVTYHAVTDNNNVSGAEGSYVPDPTTGGYIPANPQQPSSSFSSGSGSSSVSTSTTSTTSTSSGTMQNSQISTPAGGGSSSGSSGGTMQNGQTSGAAGTDGNSTSGSGKDFGSEFGDFSTFKSWDEVLSALGSFKDTVSQSFSNLKNSISSLKNTFQDDDGKSKINVSLGSGSAGSCQMSFIVFGSTVDFASGLSSIASLVRPFVSFLVFILMTVWSVRRVYIIIRGGS